MKGDEDDRLSGIVSSLIGQERVGYHKLKKGLTIAYTPGNLNQKEPGVYRLTLSRKDSWPSDTEIEIVKERLKRALKERGRIWSDIRVEQYLKGKKGMRYHVVFWLELIQAKLF